MSEVKVNDITEVELVVVNDCLPSDVNVEPESFATAQDLQSLISINSIDTASKLLKLENGYDITTMLKTFEESIHSSIKNKKTRMLKPLTESKNILLRAEIEKMIEQTKRFDLTGMIPFKEACISCHGTGEIYKFFRISESVPCKFCTNGAPEDDGYVFIKCRQCKGTKVYKGKECPRCYRDPKTDLATGTIRVKCRRCRGSKVFLKLVIDSKIKSTTHCHHCKGRGFTLPEPPVKKVKTFKSSDKERKQFDKYITSLNNPVITAQLGELLKGTNVKE